MTIAVDSGIRTDPIGSREVLEGLETISTYLGSGAASLRTSISEAATVEENAIQYFNIGIFDVDSGAIAAGSIDITSISAILKRSRGGAAFSDSGITQPTFAKATGSVSCSYQFLAAEWQTGDMYQLTVSGITATLNSTTAYIPTANWSNTVVETEDIDTNVEYIVSVVDNIDSDIADLDSDVSAVASVVGTIHDTDLPGISSDVGAVQTDTEKIYDATLGVAPADGSLASFVATGGTALGTRLPASTSLYDTVKNLNVVGITSAPVASTLADILHKNGSFTFDNTTDSLEAIADSISSGTFSITADSGTAFTVVDATYGAYGNDYFNGSLLVCTSGTNVGQARPIIDFATTSGTFTVSPGFTSAVVASDVFLLVSGWKTPEWVPVAATAINATAVVSPGVDLLDLVDTDNRETYRLNNLRIKCADPGSDTVTITLYELINNVSTAVDTFTITTDNYASYFSLFDMFGLTHVSGDDITVNATTSAGSYAITGNYQYDAAYN